MLNKDSFKEKFGTWWPKIEPFFDNGGFEPIFEKLKQDSKDGRTICPLSKDTFRCFRATELEDMKVVMMGLSPYHTIIRGTVVADGLLMGCSNTNICQPSLDLYYEGIEEEFKSGLCLPCEKDPDVYWLAVQGVLMFNASLTCEANKAGSHLEIWEPFTKYIMEEVIAKSGVPVVFLGKEAAKFKRYLAPMQWSFPIKHPASASYNGDKWSTEGVFTKVNQILKDNKELPMVWIKDSLPF